MTMRNYSAPIIRARWLSIAITLAIAATAVQPTVARAEGLESLVRNYRKSPKPLTRAAVLKFANAHPKDSEGALAFLALGATEIDQRQFGDALHHLDSARPRLPKFVDYIAYLSAQAEFELRQYPAAERSLDLVWNQSQASPFAAQAAALGASLYLQEGQPAKALAFTKQHVNDLPEQLAESLLARAYEAAGDSKNAQAQYQKVFLEHPLSREASEAQTALLRYGNPSPNALLGRCLKLIESGDYARARQELEPLVPQLTGADRDLAQVSIGASRYLAREYAQAAAYLESLQLSTPEPEAERLNYLVQSERRLDQPDVMKSTLDRLSRAYPQSHWRLTALLTVANYYANRNSVAEFEPLYKACYDAFPNDPEAAACQWKVTWSQYLRNRSASAPWFETYLKTYPKSEQASSALYFLGRIAESNSDPGAARADYDEIVARFPNHYYAFLARERLKQPAVAQAAHSSVAAQFLAALPAPQVAPAPNFVPSPATRERVARARLLASAGLDDFADSELRFGAKTDGQPQVEAIELAQLAAERDAPEMEIRYIKRYAPAYLSLPLDSSTQKLWKLAFPLPYRKPLEEFSREYSLDPYIVAGLVRQESEFNARAISRANAYGLTQVLPSTGRELSRKLKMRAFSSNMLFSPATNLELGSFYLRMLLDQLQGKWEPTLASYNAGKRHVLDWMTWMDFREPAEFIETIPINETRNYVQSVLRNADIYRRLYGDTAAVAAASKPRATP